MATLVKDASARMNRNFLKTGLISLAAGAMAIAPVLARVSENNVRALNVARNWAVTANGGLSNYRPEACMFDTSHGGGDCLIEDNSQGFTFRFLGGSPGWQQEGRSPNRESEVQVSADGREVLNVIYNGAPR